jgi:hypothetical protein
MKFHLLNIGQAAHQVTSTSTRVAISEDNDKILVTSDFLHRCTYHLSPSIRLSALSLIITSSQVTAPLTSQGLAALRETLFFSHAGPDPEVRSEILSLERRLVIRLRGAISALHKAPSSVPGQSSVSNLSESYNRKQLCNVHVSFLEWYIQTLIDDLGPSATYQKHICALKALITLSQSGLDNDVPSKYFSKLGQDQLKWPVHLPIFCRSMLRSLIDLLLNPFDDVRAAALAVLKLLPISNIRNRDASPLLHVNDVDCAISRAESLASQTGRADHADGIARLYDLLFHMTTSETRETPDHDIVTQRPVEIIETLLEKLESASANDNPEGSEEGFYAHGYLSAMR